MGPKIDAKKLILAMLNVKFFFPSVALIMEVFITTSGKGRKHIADGYTSADFYGFCMYRWR
jgi:hypothetical protein